MKLIVGLGNPGRIYSDNRHNAGFHCLDFLARRHGIALRQRRARAQVGSGEIASVPVMLAKPRTFMNRSGEAVAALVRQLHIPLSDLVIVYDDLDLPLGKIRIRERGSSGGHKGMESIIAHLGSGGFPRIRVGIAPGEAMQDIRTPDFVLSDFTPEEKAVIRDVQARVADALRTILADGIKAAMNKFN